MNLTAKEHQALDMLNNSITVDCIATDEKLGWSNQTHRGVFNSLVKKGLATKGSYSGEYSKVWNGLIK